MDDLKSTLEIEKTEAPAEFVNTENIDTEDTERLKELIESLSPEDIEKISGGRIRHEPLRAGEHWVLYDDKTIDPIGRYNSKEEVIRQAVLSENSPEQLSTLFGRYQIHRLKQDAENGNRDCVNKDFSKKEDAPPPEPIQRHFPWMI